MVTNPPAKTNIRLAFCPNDDTAYLQHDGREWSPCCGREPELVYDLDGMLEAINTLVDVVAQLQSPAGNQSRQGRRRQEPQEPADASPAPAEPLTQELPADPPPVSDASAIADESSEAETAPAVSEAAQATSASEPETASGAGEAAS